MKNIKLAHIIIYFRPFGPYHNTNKIHKKKKITYIHIQQSLKIKQTDMNSSASRTRKNTLHHLMWDH